MVIVKYSNIWTNQTIVSDQSELTILLCQPMIINVCSEDDVSWSQQPSSFTILYMIIARCAQYNCTLLVLTLIMIFSKYSWNSSSLHFSLRPNFQNQNQLAQLHHWSGSIWEYENYFRFSWMLLNLRMESMAMLRVFTMLKVQTVAELLDQRWVTSVDWFLFFVHRGETSKVFCQ